MMSATWVDPVIGAAFMLVAALLMARPPRRSVLAWSALAALGVAYGLALNLQPANFPNSNFFHYYLGAKYPVPYTETYRVLLAGEGRPQVGMRDLEDPAHLERATMPEQRAYFIRLLGREGVRFDPIAPLDSLAILARDSGALASEAESILTARLPATRIEPFRRDARTALSEGQGAHITLDYGYNGSPFYGLLRQADPLLHLPLGPAAAWEQLAWQFLGVALLAWLVGDALGYSALERITAAALVLVCQDFTSYALPGLIFTEVWVPVALAVWAAARRRWVLAGVAIAVAGLVKLFPFVLVLAGVVPMIRSFTPASRGEDRRAARDRALRIGVACVIAAIALGAVSTGTGREWGDFVRKIAVEFRSHLNMANNVSLAAMLIAGGVSDRSPLLPAVAVASVAILAAMFWGRENDRFVESIPRRMLVLVLATGLIVHSWLNYYVVLPFLLLPWIARRHRRAAVAILLCMAMAYALPGFGDPRLVSNSGVHALKLLPFVAIPAWLVGLELRDRRWSAPALRVALVALSLATGVELWRQTSLEDLGQRGTAALAAGNPTDALEDLNGFVRLDPGSAWGRRERGIALATLGRTKEALADFARAVRTSPRDEAARDDYARALMMSGRTEEAGVQFKRALSLAPADVQVLYALAGLRASQSRRSEALHLLVRARELDPGNPSISKALQGLSGGSASPRTRAR